MLGWVSFFADVSSEMIYPLLPLFLVGVLGASATELGSVEGVAVALVAVMTAWSGWKSDGGRGRRRVPWIRFGYGLPVIGKSILALAVAWPMVMLGRGIDRVGKGLRGSPRDALISDAVATPLRGRAFGYHRMMDTAGATVGVLLAATLLWWFGHSPTPSGTATDALSLAAEGSAFRVIFGISAVLGLVSLALTFLIHEAPAAPVPEVNSGSASARETESPSKSSGWLGLPAQYWLTVAVLLVFAFANSSDTFLLLRAANAGLSPVAVVLAYALYNVLYTLVSYPAGILSDRVGRWKVIATGWAIYVVVYVGFAFAGEAGVWPLMGLYGVYMALTDGVGKALVADHAPADRRGTAIGLYYMASALMTLAGSVVAGVLWDHVGREWPFLIGAATAFLALLLIPVAVRFGGQQMYQCINR
ncbi:MAG: MFS transporter [Gemmataceae bacterium]